MRTENRLRKGHKTRVKLAMISLGLIVSALAAIMLLYLGGLFISCGSNPDFLSIDSCLDSGGRWNYETTTCER